MLNAEQGARPLTNLTSPQDHIIIMSVVSTVVLAYAAVVLLRAPRGEADYLGSYSRKGAGWSMFSTAADIELTQGEVATNPVHASAAPERVSGGGPRMPARKGTAGDATSPSSAEALQHVEEGAGVSEMGVA